MTCVACLNVRNILIKSCVIVCCVSHVQFCEDTQACVRLIVLGQLNELPLRWYLFFNKSRNMFYGTH